MKKVMCTVGLATLVMVAAGCSTLGMTPPDVTLVNLEFTDLTVFETTGEFTIRLTNLNPEPMTIEGGVFTLFLNGRKVGRGLTSDVMEVPNLGTSTQKVPIFVNNLSLATRVAELLEQPVLDYRLKAKLHLRTSYGTRRLKSEYSGSFSLSGEGNDPPGVVELSSPGS
ncbi:MAG: LEA type 2 family protein [Acidobacteriota bacterium]|nr:LEA type 2 family protein [Acidobacteriota bacterium]